MNEQMAPRDGALPRQTRRPPNPPSSHSPVRPPASRASFLLSVASSVLVVLVALAAAEMSARAGAPDYLVSSRGPYVFSGTYGWAPRPGASLTIDGKRVSFNARGYRGRELARPKAAGRTRVVVLGDSIAFGLGVSDEETFTHLLDVRDNGIEAANLAVQGYGPDQALLVLLHQGLRDDPDVVVLAFCLANDFADAVLPLSLSDGRTPKPRFRLVGERLVLDEANLRQSAPQRAHQWLSDYSHLFNRAAALGPRREPPPTLHWRERYLEALRDEDYALRLNLALVRRMSSFCREQGIAFIVAVFPDRFSYREKPQLAERFFESLESAGVRALDMSVPFRGFGPHLKAVALDGIGHLHPLGHALTSEILEREIVSRTQWAASQPAD